MQPNVEASQIAAPLPRGKSFFAHLTGLYFSPGQEFRSIVQRPPILWPLLALILVNLLLWGIWLTKADMIQVMQDQAEMTGRPAPNIPSEAQGKVVMFVRASYLAVALIAGPVVGLIMAGIYLFMFRFIVASEVTFRQSYSITLLSLLVPGIVVAVLSLGVLAAKGDWNILPPLALGANLSVLWERATTAKWLFALAESVDFFSAWTVWLLAIGYGAASKRSTTSALGPVLGLWLFGVLLKVGLTALFS
jgi:hypothetical protein